MNPGNATFSTDFEAFIQSANANARFRFAPTPSGYLHLGNAFNFWLNHLSARKSGGKILLRIDDLDADRKKPEYIQDIFDTLQWLGLDWDLGPANSTDFETNWSQHGRLHQAEKILMSLRERDLVFACSKSRKDLESYKGIYPPEFSRQNGSLDDPNINWRLKTPDNFPLPYFIVRKRDGFPSYQICSLADDIQFGITHVVRGADLQPSTKAQRLIAQLLQLDDFLQIKFLHHPLLLDQSGNKLSKSAGSTALKSMRDAGVSAEAILEQLSNMM